MGSIAGRHMTIPVSYVRCVEGRRLLVTQVMLSGWIDLEKIAGKHAVSKYQGTEI